MKKFLFLLLLLPVFCKAQTNVSANVMKRQGLPVFLYSEPTKEYTVVRTFTGSRNFSDINKEQSFDKVTSIEDVIDLYIHKAKFSGTKKNPVSYDAIIISSDGKTATIIKFKSDENKDTTTNQ